MPWARVYPPMSPEKEAQIRSQVEEAIDSALVEWERELQEQIRFVRQGKSWAGEVSKDIETEKMGARRALARGLNP
jgi:hypothetical protein